MTVDQIHGYINTLDRNLGSLPLPLPGVKAKQRFEEAIAFAIFIYDRILKLDEGLDLAMRGWYAVVTPLVTIGAELEAESKILLAGLPYLTEVHDNIEKYLEKR